MWSKWLNQAVAFDWLFVEADNKSEEEQEEEVTPKKRAHPDDTVSELSSDAGSDLSDLSGSAEELSLADSSYSEEEATMKSHKTTKVVFCHLSPTTACTCLSLS